MKKHRRKLKKKIRISFIFILLLIVGFTCFYTFQSNKNENITFSINNKQKEEEEAVSQQREIEYNTCLKKNFDESELTETLVSMKQDIDNFIINNYYKTSVYYEDLTTHFTYTYKAETIYYGCSLIKLVDALYLINKAIDGEINLDTETVKYTANYKRNFSSGMAMRSFGEEVTLRDLITYAISVSDNSAHLMLINYIGFNTLKAYGESLGAKVILTGGDKFGNQTAEDTNIYLKEAYRIITENEEYGPFLKNIMDNNERNAFNTDTIKIYHKYGSYGDNYHDIGLSLEERPYAISIFTLHENSGYETVVQGIHAKIIDLHNAFYENRKNNCYNEVYGN